MTETQQWMKDAVDEIWPECQLSYALSDKEHIRQYRQRLLAILAAHAPQQWIPVSESLPEVNWYGLICILAEDGRIEVAYRRETYWETERTDGDDWPFRFDDRAEQVTHWMPLPAPPVPAPPAAQTEKEERCPSCGYTKEDAANHGDHRLCKNAGNVPWEKVAAPSAPQGESKASPSGTQGEEPK